MPVDTLLLERFGPFAEAELDLVPGVNVLLGANGTGKTFAAKALYSVLKALGDAPPGMAPREAVRAKLAGVFHPDDGDIRRLVRRVHGRSNARVRVQFDDGAWVRLTISTGSRPISNLDYPRAVGGKREAAILEAPALFLPSREVLAMYEGFVAAYVGRELSFDETYYDTAVALSAAALRGRRPGKLREVAEALEKEMGGRVRLEGPRFYLHAEQGGRLEAHLLAEGLRKVASVVHLIANGALRQGGLLIWDEPEANLHPRLAEVVVDCLLALAEGGVQVIVATHDYLVADAISRASEYRDVLGTAAEVRFFQLIREDGAPAKVQRADTFSDIPTNPLLEAFLEHHDREQQLVVRQLGGDTQ
ncbi:MAG: AAA family ATPase [Actinomycetota bacterium]|nr:AAA family ATPase [Actinomycetota bacterium]